MAWRGIKSGSTPADDDLMHADGILDSLRSLILVIDEDGVILEVRGGFGGFLGFDLTTLPGTSVFDYVHPDDADEVAVFFLESREERLDTIAVPMPFHMRVCSPDGLAHQVDVIPSGVDAGEDGTRWTAEVVPVSLFGSTTRSLDLELAGASHDEVCRMLCEELVADNADYTSRWVLVDLRGRGGPTVTTSRAEDAELVDAVDTDLAAGWVPWDGVGAGETRSLPLDTVGGATIGLLERRRWHRVIVAPVVVQRRLAGALLLLGSVPDGFPAHSVKANVAARIQRLVRTTAMLFERWDAQEQLTVAASTDELTGLLNRRAFYEALDGERRNGAVLFVDVDDLKRVNDTFGHEVGDRVLATVARRIEGACRTGDLVARLGGDEFVVLARPADESTATELVGRIERAVQRPLGLGLDPDVVTVSVGHAPVQDTDARRAIDMADAAMLDRKRSGRRRRERHHASDRSILT